MLDWAVQLGHLQAVLKEFDPTTTPNKETLLHYFQEGLHSFIQAQLDNWGRDLDVWDKVVEKAVDAKAKASLQPPSETREIDSRCPKRYRPSVKKNKDDNYRD